MANPICLTCEWEKASGTPVDTSKSNTKWAKEVGVSEGSIRRHLKHPPRVDEVSSNKASESYRETWTGNQGEMSVVISGEEISKDAILRKFGHNPETTQIVGTLEETHWMTGGEWNHRYRFKTERRDETFEQVDPIAILAKVRESGIFTWNLDPEDVDSDERSAFCISVNDIQLGQSFNGGSAATIRRFHEFVELAKERITELRETGRSLEKLVVVFGGDLVEGCVIYPNMAYSLDMDRKSQIEGVIALGLHLFDQLVPMFDDVQVLACKGNHGQHRINGSYTTLYDNDDTHTVDMMRLALSRDPEMSRIDWVIAGEEAAVACKVFDWTLATTHGDIYAKGVAGATIDKKAQNWYKNMAMGRERFGIVGQADVLIGHHYHHDKMSDWGSCLWRQTPSQDRGSLYFEQATGEYSEPGMLSWVMTESVRYQDEQILR